MRGGSSLRGRPDGRVVWNSTLAGNSMTRAMTMAKPAVENPLCSTEITAEKQAGRINTLPLCPGESATGGTRLCGGAEGFECRSPIEPETTPYFTHWEAQAAYPGAASICKGAHLAGNYSMHPFAEPRARFLP
ncbi:hypothetical protein CIRG_00930 [Coccidioides immitis RMSCC 2394]|uniref:Uncharacterized protein n=1 Tax=Coccidioides immitis RMSCC 2394 TaxID=404692 RepID=A0A0J7AU11_COCIT|nr:hypothetical protein CIRG_00930 [Coccidioides immitis RMSCC 2394]